MKDDYTGAILEDIRDKLQAIAEDVSGFHTTAKSTDKRLDAIEQSTGLIPAIKAVVTDQSRELAAHEERISSLEAAA